MLGAPDSPQCAQVMAILDGVCATLGVPTAEHKRDGLTAQLTYLGIEVDTMAGTLRLLADKLHHLQVLLSTWGDCKACLRQEL